MKILVFNNGYLTTVPSGGDRHLLDVGAGLAQEQEVTFILPDFVADLPVAKVRRKTYRSWPPQSVLGIMLAYFLRGWHAWRLARREAAEVVLSSAGPFDVLPALAHRRRFRSCMAVYVFHLTPSRRAQHWRQQLQFTISRVAQWATLRFIRRADVVFTDNHLVKAALIKRGFNPDRIHVQRPVVNIEQVRQAVPCRRFQVMFIGRMVRSKGIYDLVEALRSVPVTAGLVGAGEERLPLQHQVEAYGLTDRVQLLGPLPSAEMYALLKGCEVFVFPSHEEGYGIAVAEAIAAGKPVVACDLPHYREVFADSLITFPVGDVNALTKRLTDFFSGRMDVARHLQQYKYVQLADKETAAAWELDVICRHLKG